MLDLLSEIQTKQLLTDYLAEKVLHHYSESELRVLVVSGTTTKTNTPGMFYMHLAEHSHEEADTLIPLHVIDAVEKNGDGESSNVYEVHSPDTDVFILLIDMYMRYDLEVSLIFVTGSGNKSMNSFL